MGVEASVLSLVVVILIKDVVVPLYRGNSNGKSNGNGGGKCPLENTIGEIHTASRIHEREFQTRLDAFDAAVLIAADKHIMLDVFLHHLEKIYPVWNRDAGAWNQLLSISEIDDEIIMKIHQECCRIFDSLHPS